MITFTQKECRELKQKWDDLCNTQSSDASSDESSDESSEVTSNIKQFIDLDPFFKELENHVSSEDTNANVTDDALEASADLKANLIRFIETVLDTPDLANPHHKEYRKHEDLVKWGATLVKALDKENPLTSRAKKYLGLGIGAMFVGVAWIAGLVLGGIYLGPLTAFTFANVNFWGSVISTTVVPVWQVAVGVAGITSLFASGATLFKLSKNPSNGLKLLGEAVFAIEPIAIVAFLALTVVGACLIPIAPFIAAGLFFKKAYELSKAPTGLALSLANAFPALAEKAHYGDAGETLHAKLKKAKGKLGEFKAMTKEIENDSTSENKDNNKAFAEAGLSYYKNRIKYLKESAYAESASNKSRYKQAQVKAPEKDYEAKNVLLEAKANADDKYLAKVSVKDHRQNVDGATPRLKASLANTLFANHYHVKHAMKVEAEARAAKIAAPRV